MSSATLTVRRSGYAVVQDLGRPGHAALGVAANGAADQRSARMANTLVGNRVDAALVEVTGSELDVVTDSPVLVAVTGAALHLVVDGYPQPAREPVAVPAGAAITVPWGERGHRSYLAVNGDLVGDRLLGSVSPDPWLDVGTRLQTGDRLVVHTAYDTLDHGPLPVFRLRAPTPRLGSPISVAVTAGPDLGRLARGVAALEDDFQLLSESDHVGLRLRGPALDLTPAEEILSRGVPVGAVEVTPGGGLLILMRGRLLTAGYPVVAVVTSASLDDLAQARPGDVVRIALTDMAAARAAWRDRDAEHRQLARRVRRAFEARGFRGVLDPAHAGRQMSPRANS